MSDAEYGRAVLELVDTALDAVGAGATTDAPAFRCGTTTVQIRTAGRGSGADDAPFSHLPQARAGDTPELVVHVRAGEFPGDGQRPPRGFHRVRDDQHFVSVTDGPPTLDALRTSDGIALSWIDDAAHQQAYARFRPFSEIFSAWFPTQGMLLLHAAAVGDTEGVVLLVGDGGSGKSTTAVLCSLAGIGFLADDFCLLEPRPSPRVHSIYRSAKLRRDSARRVQIPTAASEDGIDGDRYFLVDDAATIASAPIRAIISVRPATESRAHAHLERLPPDQVFAQLLPTALKVASGGEAAYRQWLRAAHEMAHTIDAYTLELTWDTDRVVDLIRGVYQA